MEKEIYLQGSSEFLFPLQPSGIFCIVLVSFDLWHWCLEFTWLIPAPVKRGNTETFFFYSFIADAAFLYLWAKLADWRDHPDDIYTLKLKIKIHLNHIYQNIYIPSGWYIHIHSNGNIRSLNQTNSNLF